MRSDIQTGATRQERILLAEDDALNREIAALLLREEGALVTEAADGRAG